MASIYGALFGLDTASFSFLDYGERWYFLIIHTKHMYIEFIL